MVSFVCRLQGLRRDLSVAAVFLGSEVLHTALARAAGEGHRACPNGWWIWIRTLLVLEGKWETNAPGTPTYQAPNRQEGSRLNHQSESGYFPRRFGGIMFGGRFRRFRRMPFGV